MKYLAYAVAIALMQLVLLALGYFLIEDYVFMKWSNK